MPALAITATQVLIGQGTSIITRNAAVAITAGQALYVDANNLWALALAGAAAPEAAAAGIALNSAGAGQPVTAVIGGPVTLGAAAAPVVGQVYCVGVAAGAIVPHGDLVATNRLSLLGWGLTGNALQVAIQITGQVKG